MEVPKTRKQLSTLGAIGIGPRFLALFGACVPREWPKFRNLLHVEADEKVEGNIRLEAVSVDAEQLEHLDNEKVSFCVNRTLMKKVSISIQSKWWTNLPLLLRLDEDEAIENGEEEVENDEDDQIVVDQLENRAPVTKFI